MRLVAWVVVWCTVILGGGCAIWEQETTNRGGYLDHLIDDRWIKADSKSMRALRAFAIQVSLARIASVSAKNDSDRQLLAIRIGATTKRFLPVYACGFEKNPLSVFGAEQDPCFYYDSAMLDYSTALFDLAMVALPVDDAKRLMNSVTGSFVNPLNIADLLNSLLTIGKDALKYGRVVGALYRDTVELEVQIWLATPEIDNRPFGNRVTEAHVAALREIYSRGSDDMPAWISAIAALRSAGIEPVPHPKFVNQLGGLMKYICDLITTEADASKACKAGLPTTLQPPMRVLGPVAAPRAGAPIGTTSLVPTSVAPSSTAPRPQAPGTSQLTCPPTGQGQFDSTDDNGMKLRGYVSAGAVAERPTRESNLGEILGSPQVNRQLIPNRPVQLPIVLSVAECREVRGLMAIQAKEKGYIN